MSFNEYESIGLSGTELTLKSELRHLPIKERIQLSTILDVNNHWKQLAAIIPNPDQKDSYLMTSHKITVLEGLPQNGISPTQALLDYWGTYGRKRATIEDLIVLLNSCHSYRASLYLCKDLLKIDSFEHLFGIKCDNNYMNEESIDKLINDLNFNTNYSNDCNNFNDNKCDQNWSELSTKLMQNSEQQTEDKNRNHNCFLDPSAPNESLISFSTFDSTNRQLLSNEELIHYSYNEIRCATNEFSEVSVEDGGHKLGEGAFGTVFRCKLRPDSDFIAVKKLKNDFQKQFISELKVMNKFRHKNLLSISGISSDGPSLLIIYDYMSNGSLQDYMEHKPKSLLWPQRLAIALGTAEGICHLHTFDAKPYVHRDIKSANILLDNELNARVGDFGLVRVGSSDGSTSTKPLATTIFGTSIYMAPEAFRGDISVKLDSFSFGVVLLELLTGLKPFDPNREGSEDLLSYIEEKSEDDEFVVNSITDTTIGQLDENIALQLFTICRKCTEQRKKDRPTMTQVLQSLQKIEFI